MSGLLQEELDIISQAILNEVEGYEFYRMAANQAGTEDSKDAFMELANEELKHVEFLEALFNKIKKDEGDDIKLAFDAAPPSPDIYNWEKVHLEQFTEQYNIYKDEWWADQSFAPF